MLLLLAIVGGTMDLGVEATSYDINLYHLGGFLIFFFPSLGFLIETNIFGIKEKMLNAIYKHVILWIALVMIAVISFSICNGLTSEEFQTAMQIKNQIDRIPDVDIIVENTEQPIEEISKGNTEQPTEEISKENTEQPTEEILKENSEQLTEEVVSNNEKDAINETVENSSSAEDELVVEPTEETTVEDESTDIDGCVFTFDNTTYTVNGIEVTFYSVEFDKTDKALNGYQMIFDYLVKNTNNTNATLKFASTEGQFRCEQGKVLLSLSAINAGSNKYDSSPVLDANGIMDKLVMFHAVSNRFANRINGVDYDVVEIGDIYSDEHVEIDVVMTGWVGETSESVVITFNLN